MDVVSTATAVVQLIAQVVELWQQIDKARETVKSAPKVFEDTKTQAYTLSEIIRTVNQRPELHVAEIYTQVNHINTIFVEVYDILEAMALRQRKSPLRQGWHALVRAERDGAKLEDVLKRLSRAKGDLILQINVISTGIVGELRENLMNRAPEIGNIIVLEGNQSLDNANQVNAMIGLETMKVFTTAKIMKNKALGNSQQRNLIGASPSLLQLLEV
ncbi:hypothetical protein M426DRAFT_210743 [Hypoxylon sp. CI-4A]|nr:hypothetical protein M426DRAFT_210743 [Hypoxylon sp. CI-4A]